ncbi:MAG: SulP family inorganic anion transporter [Clostridia bacterium]
MNLKKEWLGNVKGDLLAGLVVCMALIPEAIGFSIVAGVDPMVGVYASFMISLITSIFGGRPGLISAAAGATALVLASLVADYGMDYLFAATILAGVLQLVLGFCKVGNLMKFIPKPVMIGFVNALAIMMLNSQIGYFQGGYILPIFGVIGVAIIVLFPYITKSIPSPIVAIIVITLIVNFGGIDVKMLGDMGEISSKLPSLIFPKVPLTIETLKIIFPYSMSVALVGIVESLLTSQLVDEITDTHSDKNRECVGQGLANIGAGFFGGIAGCGMIGQTVINTNYGGRGRLSTLMAGTCMLFAVIVLNKYVVLVPVVALASVMLVVAFKTFNWGSIGRVKHVPKTDTLIMISTVIVVLLTDNLAYGVVVGFIISAITFASKMSNVEADKVITEESITYNVSGELFFASSTEFIALFDYSKTDKCIFINFENVKIWDESAVDAIDKVVLKYRKIGVNVTLVSLSDSCLELVDKLAIHHKEDIKVRAH